MRSNFLVCYDYGMGGIWRIVLATNKDEIVAKFPMLIIDDYQHPPQWCTKEQLEKIEKVGVQDIDGPYDDWFSGLMRGEA